MSRPKVLIAEPLRFSPEAVAILREGADVELREVGGEELSSALDSCDVFWFRLGHRIDGEALGRAPRCRMIACPVTGLDHIDLQACEERGIRVLSLRGETEFLRRIRGTAELTIALVLALLRRIPDAAASVHEGTWDRDRFQGGELFGKKAGIVGIGRLGTIVAEYLSALGMSVHAFDPRPDFPHDVAKRITSLEELAASVDILTVHASLGPGSYGLVDARVLRAMPREAVLVNTARGGIVDEAALLDELRSGGIAGAALDVLEGEPDIDERHPLVTYARDHDNLLITPHIGGNTRESWVRTECFLARRVVEALEAQSGVTGA